MSQIVYCSVFHQGMWPEDVWGGVYLCMSVSMCVRECVCEAVIRCDVCAGGDSGGGDEGVTKRDRAEQERYGGQGQTTHQNPWRPAVWPLVALKDLLSVLTQFNNKNTITQLSVSKINLHTDLHNVAWKEETDVLSSSSSIEGFGYFYWKWNSLENPLFSCTAQGSI